MSRPPHLLLPALLATLAVGCLGPGGGGGGGRGAGGPAAAPPAGQAWMDAVVVPEGTAPLRDGERAVLAEALARVGDPDDFPAYSSAMRRIVEFGARVVPYLGHFGGLEPDRGESEPAERARARTLVPVLLETILADREPSAVRRALGSPYVPVVLAAAAVLGERGDRAALPALVELLDAKDERVRRAGIESLRRITGEFLGYRPDASSARRREAVARWRTLLEEEA